MVLVSVSEAKLGFGRTLVLKFLVEKFIVSFIVDTKVPGLSSLGVPGLPLHPQILADQLTLSQPGGTLCPPNYYWHLRIFRPSDGPSVKK